MYAFWSMILYTTVALEHFFCCEVHMVPKHLYTLVVHILGNVWRLPRDVSTVWLRVFVLLCLPTSCILGTAKQCSRNTNWCFQALQGFSKTIFSACIFYWCMAGTTFMLFLDGYSLLLSVPSRLFCIHIHVL